METNHSLKLVCDSVIKRVNNLCLDYDDLNKTTRNVFNLPETARFITFYLDSLNKKCLITNESDYKQFISHVNNTNTNNACVKIFIEFEQIKVEDINTKTEIKTKAQNQKFYHQCDICLEYPILDTKYICLICKQLYICQKCELYHNHPLVKCKSNTLSSAEDICNLLLNSYGYEKNSFSDIFNKKLSLTSVLKEKFSINKHILNIKTETQHFFADIDSTIYIPFQIANIGVGTFPQDTLFYVKNCRELYFEIKQLRKLFLPKEIMNLTLECKTSNKSETYDLELHVYNKDIKIEYKPVRFTLKVGSNLTESVYGDIQDGYVPDDRISTLPNNKKEVLVEIMKHNLSSLDIFELCKRLDKHNWVLTELALKDIK